MSASPTEAPTLRTAVFPDKAEWLINGRFVTQQMTGVQRYAHEIVRSLDAILTENENIAQRIGLTLMMPRSEVVHRPSLHKIPQHEAGSFSGHLWDQLSLPRLEQDGILSLGNFGPVFARRQIVCIHDANTFIVPESYSRPFRMVYQSLLPWIGRNARRVATVSEFSAMMLVKYGISRAEKIFVAPNGYEHVLRWDRSKAQLPLLNQIKRPYVLVLGSRAQHKNVGVILDQAKVLDEAGIDLVIAGGASGIFSAEGGAPASQNCHFTGFVGDDELAALYAGAVCLAFPSRTEGFGIPPLEAMASGCPVVSSDAASLPEVGGDAVIYVKPDDRRGWGEALVALSRNPDLRGTMIAKGRQRAALFSWEKSASLYLDEMLAVSRAAQ
ncbi:MAG: glycosyltransferase family 4 protein [Xanthobacteraceae bacterium]|nr:glycosyltransferase family 4 protein [Xanthobacteraceae bacterium]